VAQGKHIRCKADKLAVARGCYYDPKAGDRVIEFFRKFLKHSTGEWAGRPFELLPWQADEVIRPLFGWKRADGTRRFRLAYIEIPKKNGKTTLCSGIALYLLVGDGEAASQVFSAACDRIQAGMVFQEARSMVRQSPELAFRLDCVDSTKRIVWKETGSVYRVLSGESRPNEGLNIHGLIFDELHAQPNRELWDALRYGGAARRQPMIVSITTAGYDRHSICWEQHEYASKVADGVIEDDAFFSYIRAAGPDDDWKLPSTWAKANPSMGITVNDVEMASACKEAQESPVKENAFRRYRLNQWTEQDVRWLSLDRWDKCAGRVDVDDLAGRECYIGLDLSTKKDITAAVALFPPRSPEEKHVAICRMFIPSEFAQERERRDRVPYVKWANDGHITMTAGDVIDYDAVESALDDWLHKYEVVAIGYDPWNATSMALKLQERGANVLEYRQGYASLSEPTKELEKLVLSGRLIHGGHPVLRWMASNVCVESDSAGNIKPSKKKSTERIDGIVALIMALGLTMRTQAPMQTEIY
jgi:phage terminase large subunit-like protein